MLSEKRIKEAETNVKNYLKEGMVKKTDFNSKIFDILRNNAKESLSVANFLYQNNKSSLLDNCCFLLFNVLYRKCLIVQIRLQNRR